MKIGICKNDPEMLSEVGCDYAEIRFSMLASMTEEEYEDLKKRHLECGVKVYSTNVILSGGVILSEREHLPDFGLSEFLECGYRRLSELGGKYAVIGSGAARRYNESETKQKGIERFARFAAFACEIARKYGIVNVVESLNSSETNVVLTLADSYEIIELAKRPENLAILADFYHMEKEETLDSIRTFGKYIKHCHIAAPITRCVPLAGDGNEDYYKEIFSALSDIGYDGNVSVESFAPNGAESYKESVAYLKMLANNL